MNRQNKNLPSLSESFSESLMTEIKSKSNYTTEMSFDDIANPKYVVYNNDSESISDLSNNKSYRNVFFDDQRHYGDRNLRKEDSIEFLADFNKGNFNLLKENWEKEEFLHARVTLISENIIYVDCIIDKNLNIIENRAFDKIMFRNIPGLKVFSPVIINIKQKPGSIRIDIKNGKGIVEEKRFSIHEQWEILKEKNISKKLSKW